MFFHSGDRSITLDLDRPISHELDFPVFSWQCDLHHDRLWLGVAEPIPDTRPVQAVKESQQAFKYGVA